MSTPHAETTHTIEGNRYVKYFGPQWFAPTMGLGALAIALHLAGEFLSLPILLTAAQAGTALTALITVAFVLPWLLRFFQYPEAVNEDLSHPIRSQFFPTMPISLLIIGIGMQTTMGGLLSQGLINAVTLWLFALGSLGVFGFGVLLSEILFTNTNIGTKHGVFAWYIPPVSHIIIPILGMQLLENGLDGGALGSTLYITSMAAMGVGTFMFLFLAPIILHRYAYEDLPDSKLAPTFLIGVAPTSVLIIDIAHIIRVLESGAQIAIEAGSLIPSLKLAVGLLWGFSAWWCLLTIAIIVHYVTQAEHPFSFTWWAYTFPLGAFAIATNTTGHLLGLSSLNYLSAGVTGLLFLVILTITTLTGNLIRKGEAFVPE
ncbi:MAG: C4-dicarboxylate transporter [Salinarchaeum sp.]